MSADWTWRHAITFLRPYSYEDLVLAKFILDDWGAARCLVRERSATELQDFGHRAEYGAEFSGRVYVLRPSYVVHAGRIRGQALDGFAECVPPHIEELAKRDMNKPPSVPTLEQRVERIEKTAYAYQPIGAWRGSPTLEQRVTRLEERAVFDWSDGLAKKQQAAAILNTAYLGVGV